MIREPRPPPVGRYVTRSDAQEPYEPQLHHFRWNKTESDPGYLLARSNGPPKPSSCPPKHDIYVCWIWSAKKKAWEVYEILGEHPHIRYARYTEPEKRERHDARDGKRGSDVKLTAAKAEVKNEPSIKDEPKEDEL